jgi:hypothetical protein
MFQQRNLLPAEKFLPMSYDSWHEAASVKLTARNKPVIRKESNVQAAWDGILRTSFCTTMRVVEIQTSVSNCDADIYISENI